ncbi:MAG: phospholipid carrier-dependent glycosyltransferase [Candidatus Omnitrophica bacterium]|nr:phospholipid carrier-dependent glycosyltransferase [Candidatus Omnitrophota bacterium]
MTDRVHGGMGAAMFAVVLGVFLFLSPAHFLTSPDEELNLRTTLSLLQGYGGAIPSLEGFASKTGKNGHEYAQYGLGLPLASLPWCALGVQIDPTAGAQEQNSLSRYFTPGASMDPVGTKFLRGWMTIFTMILSAWTVVLVFWIVPRLGLSLSNSLWISFLLAFGCYTWPHGRTFFTEPLSAFCLLAAVGCFLKSRESARENGWILCAGIFWAYAVLTRLDSLITAPAAAWLLCIGESGKACRLEVNFKRIAAFSLPWIVVLGIIISYNYIRFGSMAATGYEDQPEKIRFLTPLLAGLHGFLFTPGRSVFLYSPPLILAIFGAGALWRSDRRLAGGVFLLIAGYLAVMSKWQNWAGGYDWGPRHIYQITPFLALLAAAWMGKRSLFDAAWKRIGWMTFGALSCFIQILGLSADSVFIIKWFLSRMLRSFPENSLDAITPYILQMPIYLPQFSSPALHWQWMIAHGPDFLILQAAAEQQGLLLFFAIPLLMIVIGGVVLWRRCRKASTFSTVEKEESVRESS